MKQAGMKEKNNKRGAQTNEKVYGDQTLLQKSYEKGKHLGCSLCKILGTIIKMNKGGNQTNRPKDKKIDDYAPILYPRDDIDYMCQEKKEEEDTLALRIDLMHQYKDSKTTLKRIKKD